MLKLTYTDEGLLLNHLNQSLDNWVSNRILLALRSGIPFWIESTKVCFMLPMNLPCINQLIDSLGGELNNTLELALYDKSQMELKLFGTWLSSHPDNEEGVFVCNYNDKIEDSIDMLLKEYNRHLITSDF
jgi:hypothetical protein